MPDSLTDALEAAANKLEAVVALRERDSVRLVKLEAAANDAIAAIDTLLGDERGSGDPASEGKLG